MSYGDILRKLNEIQELPTLPTIVNKVLTISNSPNSTAKDLNRVISQDQALASKTLKLVNSAYYGFPRTVTRITEAVVILGFNAVKKLALSASVCGFVATSDKGTERKQLWKHSVGAAVASTIIAKRAKIAGEAEDFFITGLLHDIGIIIEDQFFHEEFIKALSVADERIIPIELAEKEVFGADHAIIGKKITEIWKLPSRMGNIIGFHHQPQYAFGDTKKDTCVIYFADLICKLKKFGFDGDKVIPKLRKEPFQVLGIEKDDIKDLSKEFDTEIKKAEDFLKLVEE